MGVIILLLVVLGLIAAWWLSQQRLMSKPWLEAGPIGDITDDPPLPAAKIGLGVFIAVASALFALFLSAYSMRMQMGDWRPLPPPTLLWLNTLVLIVGSVALEWTLAATRRSDIVSAKSGLLAAGASSTAFLAGQILAWQQLVAAGYVLTSNPANAFFYVLTAAHALHVLGGLAALGRTARQIWGSAPIDQVRLSVELCAAYWHFLLFVWIVLFGVLLLGPSDSIRDFLAWCGLR